MASKTEIQNRFLKTYKIILSKTIKKIMDSNPINSITTPKLPPPLRFVNNN